MLQLMLVRHAKATPGAPGIADHSRALSSRGAGEARALGAFLLHHSLLPASVLCSPALRTRETWAALSAHWPNPPPARFEQVLYEETAGALLDVIHVTDAASRSLMVVGHNPVMQDLALRLTATGEPADLARLRAQFPTCALAILNFEVQQWDKVHDQGGRLHRFLDPKTIQGPVL